MDERFPHRGREVTFGFDAVTLNAHGRAGLASERSGEQQEQENQPSRIGVRMPPAMTVTACCTRPGSHAEIGILHKRLQLSVWEL